MSILIKPSNLRGKLIVPPSKSLSHRAIISASLCQEASKVSNLVFSDDIRATIEGMKILGADIEEFDNYILVKDLGKENKSPGEINCNESGSTLRFLIPLSLVLASGGTFTGKGRLVDRPLDVYYEIFDKNDIEYKSRSGKLPLYIRGQLKSGSYSIPGNISSQFITGLLFALPLLDGDSEIKVIGDLESKNYVDLTISVMEKYQVYIERGPNQTYYIRGKQNYKGTDYMVEGDFSQAAFFLVANSLGSKVQCLGLNYQSLQGDKEILNIIEKYSSPLDTLTIDCRQIPDLVPIITVLASLKENCITHIVNAGRLRLKESDRLKAISSELNKLGASVEEKEDGLVIRGQKSLRGQARVRAWKDHRIAMALAIAAIKCEYPFILEGYQAVNKSYPDFWEDYRKLGGSADELNYR